MMWKCSSSSRANSIIGSSSALRSGYFTTKLIPVALAFLSHAAWSSRNASKSPKTTSSHTGGVLSLKSNIGAGTLRQFPGFRAGDRVDAEQALLGRDTEPERKAVVPGAAVDVEPVRAAGPEA